MISLRHKILLILLFISLSYCGYEVYRASCINSRDAINISSNELSSTKEWQDTVLSKLIKRNEIINDVLNGKYDNNKKWIAQIKQIECAPLLDGDVVLIEYMSKYPMQFVNWMSNIRVEYSNIRQLTKDEVIMDTKISFMENNTSRSYDYEIIFRNIDNKWLLSKFTFTE